MSALARDIEGCAALAWSFGHMDPIGEGRSGRLLRRMVGLFSVELVDRGVPAGRVILDLTDERRDCWLAVGVRHQPCLRPTRARIALHQRSEDMVMAAARGCAMFVAWALGERWDEARLDATALAIVMPIASFLGSSWTVAELADHYGVDEHLVHQRRRLVGGCYASGERPAVTA